ncbi:unnamed protein product, partial [Candidula unifasciata]
YCTGSRVQHSQAIAMNEFVVKEIGIPVQLPPEITTPCDLIHQHNAVSFICAAIG